MRSPKLNLDQPAEAIDTAEARMRQALGLSTRPAANGSGQGGQAGHGHPPAPGPVSHKSARPRRRFAQDGEVPVVMLSRGRDSEAAGENRLATLSAELREERQARSRADRALDEANLAIQSLKTKLAHMEMTFEEKLRDEGEARAQIEALRLAEQEARLRAETRQAETALALTIAERRVAELEAASARPATDLFGEAEPAKPARRATPLKRKTRVMEADVAVEADADAKVDATVEAGAASEVAPEAASAEEDKPIEWWLPSFRATRNTVSRKRKPG